MQDYTLNYIYNSDYNKLIFTGETCLRKVYGLDRLSEDLDFDFVDSFDIDKFSHNISKYYKATFSIKIDTKISNNNRTVFLKLPIDKNKSDFNMIDSDVLFLRCDFSKDTVGAFNTEVNTINTSKFSFFVKNYDLPTLFANKIVAFLERSFYEGELQKLPLKGRDVYDLFWLINLSSRTSFSIKPNFERLIKLTGEEDVKMIAEEIKNKLRSIDPKYVYEDLYPLVESQTYLEQFIENYKDYIDTKIDYVMVP